jgi:hypothetical protein
LAEPKGRLRVGGDQPGKNRIRYEKERDSRNEEDRSTHPGKERGSQRSPQIKMAPANGPRLSCPGKLDDATATRRSGLIRERHSDVPTAGVFRVIGVGTASPPAPPAVEAWLRAEAILDSEPG